MPQTSYYVMFISWIDDQLSCACGYHRMRTMPSKNCTILSSLRAPTDLAIKFVIGSTSTHYEYSLTNTCMQVCNHKFHGECLQQWGDTSCPVCRYCVGSGSSSSCESCGTSTNLWICLICGNVGCGRYKDAHARSHFEQTNHCYTLELETGRV